jgi:hypothetical protein
MKSFKNWELQDLQFRFGLNRKGISYPILDEWLKSENDLSDSEIQKLDDLAQILLENADFWNEDELKMYFISPLLMLVNFRGDKYTAFFQRPLSSKIDDEEIGGIVDMVVATGYQKPVKPFFFLHEYKQERRRDNDPLGQLLAEMIVAQNLNQDNLPVYGCYVAGRNWFFVVLNQKDFAVSDVFVATQKDIYQIVKILRQVKVYIQGRIS